MTHSLITRAAVAAIFTTALATTALGGREGVDPTGPVFIPPSLGPVFVPPMVQIPGAPTAPGAGSRTGILDAPGEDAKAAQQTAQAANATRSFNEAKLICVRISDAVYGIDCLADQMAQYAADLPAEPEFSEARAIVEQTAAKLRSVAKRNQSRTKRPANLREASGADPVRSSRPIIPVAPERLESANSEATAILREAETLLLRAAEQSERRKVAFSQVAEAVGSSTLLLRSA